MINDNQTSTRNTRFITGPATEVVRDTDDILNIDTTLGVVNLTLPSIVGSGLMLNPRCILINDIGLASDVNNINIYSSGGDLINNAGVLIISTSGANAKCTIANQTEWAVSGTVVSPAGITGAGILNRVAKFTSSTSIGNSLISDNGVSVSIGAGAPSASAIFQIDSTTQGVAFPRMTTVQQTAIAAPIEGLLVYNTTTKDYEYYNGVAWVGTAAPQSLSQVLSVGNTTGANNINIQSGQSIRYNNSGFIAAIAEPALLGNITLTLPSSTGTLALTSDIPATPNTIYTSNDTIGTTRVATLTDTLYFVVPATGITGVRIGNTGITSNSTLHVLQASAGRPSIFQASDNNNNNVNLRISNGSGAAVTEFKNGGNVNLALTSTPIVTIGVTTSATAKFTVTGSGSSLATINQQWRDSGLVTKMQLNDDGTLGINVVPSATNRLNITAGAGFDGAINLSAFNLANNGYGILLQGGSGGATYNGIWSDANGGSTTDNRAFYGISSVSGPANNYGAEFRAREGSTTSIGVWGRALGGDSVVPSFASVGVQGSVESVVATNRRAGYFYTVSNVDNGITYGVKSEVDSSGVNAVNYGIHSRSNGSVGTGVNYAAWLQADGGSGATNYALVTNGGNIGFGTTTPNAQALLELVSTSQAFLIMRMTAAQASAITPANGMGLYVTDTDATFTSVGFWKYEAGAWATW